MEEKSENKNKKKNKGFLSYIIGGKLLRSDIFIKNTWLLALIAVYAFIYVSNRYAFQQELKQIKQLERTKNDIRYDLLTIQSEFAKESRQSKMEEMLNKKQSLLKTSTYPPFIIE